MPNYHYRCINKECDYSSTEFHSLKDRLVPCEQPCPKCLQLTVRQQMQQVGIVSGIKEPSDAPGEFKELLRDMHKKAGRHSEIDV